MLSKAQIKYIHSLQHKKYRQKSGRFVAEGVKMVDELLESEIIQVESVYGTEHWFRTHENQVMTHGAIGFTMVSSQELSQITGLKTPNLVLALCHLPHEGQEIDLAGRITLMLETIQDPGNLGTIIRIADWFGLSHIICSPDSVDAFNPKTIQSTMGSVARVRVMYRDLDAVISPLKDQLPVYATTLHGKDIASFSKINAGLLLMGNESRGLTDKMLGLATHQLTIPRLGHAESLNVAVATGIICSHLLA